MNEWLNDFYGAFLVNFCDLKKKAVLDGPTDEL